MNGMAQCSSPAGPNSRWRARAVRGELRAQLERELGSPLLDRIVALKGRNAAHNSYQQIRAAINYLESLGNKGKEKLEKLRAGDLTVLSGILDEYSRTRPARVKDSIPLWEIL